MRRWAAGEGGQTLILAALLMTVLFYAVGIAVNLGVLFVERRTAQEAVDAAAFAGAVVLYDGGTAAAAKSAAWADLALNGFANTSGVSSDPNVTITTDSPPASGAYSGNASYIKISLTIQARTPLLPSEGGLTQIGVSATAGSTRRPSAYAFMVLNSSVTQAFLMTGTGNVTVNGGDVQINSSSSTAAVRTGTGNLVLQAGHVANDKGGQTGFTNITTGQPVAADPISGRLRPSTTGLTDFGTVNLSSGTTTLNPGIYSGGIQVTGTATVNMNPGTYIIRDGGINVTSSGDINGTGVMIFNTLTNYPTETGSCGLIQMNNSGQIHLSAPTTGYYQGLLFFQDTTCTQDMNLNGSASISASTGTIYVPKARVRLQGTGNITITGQVIADMVEIDNQSSLTVTYDTTNTAQPSLPSLVE